MSEQERDIVLGPAFTAGVVLLLYAAKKRSRGAAILGLLAVGANFLPVTKRLQEPLVRRPTPPE